MKCEYVFELYEIFVKINFLNLFYLRRKIENKNKETKKKMEYISLWEAR